MDGGWSDPRLETTYHEARAVLEAQNETVADVDDKAMWTVRVTVILVGLIVSAVEFTGGSVDHLWLTIGSGMYFGSLVAGVLTYSESELYSGPKRTYVDQLRRDRFEDRAWQQDLLATYGEWIEANRREVRRAGRLLLLTQVLLIAGVVCTAAAVVF